MNPSTASHEKTRLWVSGLAPASTGIGVFQRQIYTRLANDFSFDLCLGPQRVLSRKGSDPSFSHFGGGEDAWSFMVQLFTPVRGQIAFVTTTPTPLSVRVPTVGVVHDLRWIRTRGPIARLYRRMDLARLVRMATRLVAISDRVRLDLISIFPEAEDKTEVVYHGPGNVGAHSFTAGEPGTVLLIGSAPHKRNHIGANALARAQPLWARKFIGLNVSSQVKATLENAFGAARCEWFSELDAAGVQALYERAETFVCLSLEEGFGLPFIEALAAGCNVLAIRQQLTEALLDDSAVLLENGDGERIASQLARLSADSWPSISKRRAKAAQFSWDIAAYHIALLLRSARQPGKA